MFLALLFAVLTAFIMALTERVRIYGLQERLTEAGKSALDSLFSMYDKDLMEEYDLLLLNINELEGEKDPEEILEFYLTRCLDSRSGNYLLAGNLYRGCSVRVEVEEEIAVTESEGELFARNILEYMKYRTLGIAAEEVEEQLSDAQKGEDAKKEADKEQQEVKEQSQESLLNEITEEEQERYKEIISDSWLDTLDKLRKDGWLDYILPIDRAASCYEITDSDLPSSWRTVNLTWHYSGIGEIEEGLLFTEYLLEHCHCFTSAEEVSGMAYELEYILNAKKTDKENLKSTIISLLIMREGLNIFSVLSSPSLLQQAEAAADVMVGWTGSYPVIQLVKLSITAGWSFAEAIIDLRTLLSGGKVPLIKGVDTWSLSLDQMGNFLSGDLLTVGSGDKGLSYSEYLRLLLYSEDKVDRRFRTMDVIQLRVRLKNPDFYLEDCLGGIRITAEMKARQLFFSFSGRQYSISSTQSRMY